MSRGIHQENEMTHSEIRSAFAVISPRAIGTGADADGALDGSDQWEHPSAAAARDVAAMLLYPFDFRGWSETETQCHAALERLQSSPVHSLAADRGAGHPGMCRG